MYSRGAETDVSTRHEVCASRTCPPMSDIAAPDASRAAIYRQMLLIAFVQVRQRLARTARQLQLTDPDERRLAADALPRHVGELRRFVQALTIAPERGEMTLAGELADAYFVAIRVIEERLANKQLSAACELARRLVELIALELSWMPKP